MDRRSYTEIPVDQMTPNRRRGMNMWSKNVAKRRAIQDILRIPNLLQVLRSPVASTFSEAIIRVRTPRNAKCGEFDQREWHAAALFRITNTEMHRGEKSGPAAEKVQALIAGLHTIV